VSADGRAVILVFRSDLRAEVKPSAPDRAAVGSAQARDGGPPGGAEPPPSDSPAARRKYGVIDP
jgi:hypothetical protein